MNFKHVAWAAVGGAVAVILSTLILGDLTRQSTADGEKTMAVRRAETDTMTAERAAGCVFRGKATSGAVEALEAVTPVYYRDDHVKKQDYAQQPWLDGEVSSKVAYRCATDMLL